jgi:vacuolar iron transporter family protein
MAHLDGEEDTWPPSSSSLNLQPLKISEKTPDLESQHGRRPRFKVDPRMVSDAIIGLSDGLTVPFALTAGLSALGSTKIVVYGGLAELIAGAISMGLGGYLGAKSELYVLLSPLTQTQPAIPPRRSLLFSFHLAN